MFVGWAGVTAGVVTMIVGINDSTWTNDGHISRFSTTALARMVTIVWPLRSSSLACPG
jgi:hypothetical protein